jgi:SAM-dependent methyltransferase
VREAAGADNSWVGTDIADEYFPVDKPADTTYQHQSMTEPWPVEWTGSFDLVHSRLALPGIGMHPLEEVVKNLIGLVKPGGWIQLVEIHWDGWTVGPEGAIFMDATKSLFSLVTNGQGVDLLKKLVPILKEAGLQNIEHGLFPIRYGASADEHIRATTEASLFATAMGVSISTKQLPPISIPREKLDKMPQELLAEAKEQGSEIMMFALWAQKTNA